MAKYNKIVIAADMFVEAHKRFISAKSDIDFIVAIVMAGSVLGIISPLLKEQGGRTTHQILAEISNLIVKEEDADFHEGIFREIYNSFKHTGSMKKGLKPSEDTEVEAELKKEAAYMLDAARDDFREVKIIHDSTVVLPDEFLNLIESENEYY